MTAGAGGRPLLEALTVGALTVEALTAGALRLHRAAPGVPRQAPARRRNEREAGGGGGPPPPYRRGRAGAAALGGASEAREERGRLGGTGSLSQAGVGRVLCASRLVGPVSTSVASLLSVAAGRPRCRLARLLATGGPGPWQRPPLPPPSPSS